MNGKLTINEHDRYCPAIAGGKCNCSMNIIFKALEVAANLHKENEKLKADNVLLRGVIRKEWEYQILNYDEPEISLRDALKQTPAQSLAEIERMAMERMREACAEIAHAAHENMETLGLKHPSDSENRARCFVRAREAYSIYENIRNMPLPE
jgi:hypothetical protein